MSDELIDELRRLCDGLRHFRDGNIDIPDFYCSTTQVIAIVRQVNGPGGFFTKQLADLYTETATSPGRTVPAFVGIANGFLQSVEKGFHGDWAVKIKGESYVDYLELAERILEDNTPPAIVIAAATFERVVKELALKSGIPTDSTIEPMNQELYKQQVYDSAMMKQVTAWGGVRNDVLHGNWDKYDRSFARLYIEGVRQFAVKYLSS